MKVKYCPYLDGDEPQVNNTFHQENEKLRALCVAQEAEIARLQSAIDELKSECYEQKITPHIGEWHNGWRSAHKSMLIRINRITGENK